MNPQPKLIPTATNIPMLAPFWADIDMTTGPGKVYYQEHNRVTDDDSVDPLVGTDQLVFAMAERHVQTAMGDTGFYPTSVIIITWQAVSPYPSIDTYANEVWILH